jgi:hypothetical protein
VAVAPGLGRPAGVDFLTGAVGENDPAAAGAPVLFTRQPGDDSTAGALWAGFAGSGLGLPLQPHAPGADPEQALAGLPAAAALAASLPWHARPRLQVTGAGGLECRSYGRTLLARVPPATTVAAPALDVAGAAPGSVLRLHRATGELVEERPLTGGNRLTIPLGPAGEEPLLAFILPATAPGYVTLRPGARSPR